jgi:hypothetical protein
MRERAVESTRSDDNAFVRWYPWITVVTGALILIQAFLAGRGLFKDYDLIEVHGILGNITFIFGILLVIGAWLARQAGVLTNLELGISVVLLALISAQIGLGYSGRDNGDAAALHIPNGILVTMLSGALIALSFARRPMETR